MKALLVDLIAQQPLLLTHPGGGEENSAVSYSYIPGSVLRGLLVGCYLNASPKADLAGDPEARVLFFDGTVRFLNAYPRYGQHERMLPVPHSWYQDKEEQGAGSGEFHDFAVEEPDDDDIQWKGFRIPFCRLGSSKAYLYRPSPHVATHNATQGPRGQKGKDQSTVFRYEAIAAGEHFRGVILSEDESALDCLQKLLKRQQAYHLGGSRNAGYGRVCLKAMTIVEGWQEYPASDEEVDGKVIVTLLSDTILRDTNGQIRSDISVVLRQRPEHSFQRVKIVGGFNRKWGLPLPQAHALAAGSVYVLDAASTDLNALRQLEREGIGARREEGFGRLAINWHTADRNDWERWSPKSEAPDHRPLSDASRTLARKMATRRLRSTLDTTLTERVQRMTISSPPENAQLSRLRVVLREAWHRNEPDLLIRHLQDLTRDTTGQFRKARIEDQTLLKWLEQGFQEQPVWPYFSSDQQRIASEEAELTPEIRLEYHVRLADALLRKTTKEKKEGSS